MKKLAVLDDELASLRALGIPSTERLDGDHFLKHGVERSLQICVEVVIDVAQRILALEGRAPAPTSFDALRALQTLAIITSAERYRHMVQFRNFVVHRDETVDSAVLVTILRENLGDFDAFRAAIQGVE